MATATLEVHAGSLEALRREGRLRTKLGPLPVVVFWHDGEAFAVEDRCPHMGFPLHRGTVESGLLTCHWHHARFDLVSGCTLDLWADDVRAFAVELRDGAAYVRTRPEGDAAERHRTRLREGLEQGITLVVAKAVLALLDAGGDPREAVRVGVEFGARNRDAGWGAGLTTLVAMANLAPHLDPADRGLALVHGLAFVSRDTRGRAPRFTVGALDSTDVPPDRLARWYRRFVDTRSPDAAERVLATAIAGGHDPEPMMFAALTDHVFVDEGHALDFTNKAFESLVHLGADAAPTVLPTLVRQTAQAERSEESAEWRHPYDLAALVARTVEALPERPGAGGTVEVAALAWELLDDDPESVCDALLRAVHAGASGEEVGRALAYAAALRIARFHVQNDHGDWNSVHHAFTAANALHAALARHATRELLRGAVHVALRIHLDRFLNVPAARLPTKEHGDLDALARCFDVQGAVDDAGNEAYGYLRAGGSRAELIAALGHALLAEDAEFHWFQTVEAGVRQARQWPDGSDESAIVLAAVARFLAAHTPTRRELPTVVGIAARLRRGDALYEELA
jgi:nitrite reductase/ring-hydroxylating ferredoxin subunit